MKKIKLDSRTVEMLDRYAVLLDSSIKIPGTSVTIGWDGLIGLIPGVGDFVAGGLSCYILWKAFKIGLPRHLLLRMAGNILLESGVGTIPILGDIFDFVFKANRRNVGIIQDFLHKQKER